MCIRDSYTLTARARGYSDFVTKIKIDEDGKLTTVEATLAPGVNHAESALVTSQGQTFERPGSRRRFYAIGAMATGGASLVTGIVFGVLAHSKWNDAKAV